jgi:hypothetical protein
MYTASFTKEALNITIHNQYPGLELTSPIYFSTSTTYCISPCQQTDTSNTIEASFRIDSKQHYFKGALLYKLQRKHATKIDNQPDNSTASNEDTVISTYLLVVWNIVCYDHKICVYLVECTNNFAWDEDKLWALYEEYNDRFYVNHKYDIITWSTNDYAMIKTGFDIKYGSDYKLDIAISEGIENDDTRRPIQIDPERSVLSLLMLIVLMYAVRLNIPPSFKLSIHNQCLDIDLVSPIYITGIELECRRPPDYKVCAGGTMRFAFIIGLYGLINKSSALSYGVLVYKLQRKQTHESTEVDEDASNSAHLLVIWETFESQKLNAFLVEHDRGFDWDKDSLRELYRNSINQFKLYSGSTTDIWSLNDNVALMITSEIVSENYIFNITISEVRGHDGTRTPAHVDPER